MANKGKSKDGKSNGEKFPFGEESCEDFPDSLDGEEIGGYGIPYGDGTQWDWDYIPGDEEIAGQNELMVRRRDEFRLAAEYVTRALTSFPEVEKILLIGSVAVPLEKEVPRFREYKRAGIKIWHECRDLDMAIWLTDLCRLGAMRKAYIHALESLLAEKDIGVASHQVEQFIIEPGSDRYLGRLCNFNTCPKDEMKPECRVPGCGEIPFLKQHERFTFYAESLNPDKSIVLFDRRKTK